MAHRVEGAKWRRPSFSRSQSATLNQGDNLLRELCDLCVKGISSIVELVSPHPADVIHVVSSPPRGRPLRPPFLPRRRDPGPALDANRGLTVFGSLPAGHPFASPLATLKASPSSCFALRLRPAGLRPTHDCQSAEQTSFVLTAKLMLPDSHHFPAASA